MGGRARSGTVGVDTEASCGLLFVNFPTGRKLMVRPRIVNDEQINRAAREVFLEHGPGAPVSLIAERLGVSHAALFGRAGSKKQLMLGALCPGRPVAMEWLGESPPPVGVRERLAEILVELMQFLHRVVPNLVILRAAGESMDTLPGASGPPPPVALRIALTGWLEAAVSAGSIPAVHAPSVAEGLLGAMEARCFNLYLGGESFAPGDDREFLEELLGGLLGCECGGAGGPRGGGNPA
jgi:AcrR family transcriptional regulator